MTDADARLHLLLQLAIVSRFGQLLEFLTQHDCLQVELILLGALRLELVFLGLTELQLDARLQLIHAFNKL